MTASGTQTEERITKKANSYKFTIVKQGLVSFHIIIITEFILTMATLRSTYMYMYVHAGCHTMGDHQIRPQAISPKTFLKACPQIPPPPPPPPQKCVLHVNFAEKKSPPQHKSCIYEALYTCTCVMQTGCVPRWRQRVPVHLLRAALPLPPGRGTARTEGRLHLPPRCSAAHPSPSVLPVMGEEGGIHTRPLDTP